MITLQSRLHHIVIALPPTEHYISISRNLCYLELVVSVRRK